MSAGPFPDLSIVLFHYRPDHELKDSKHYRLQLGFFVIGLSEDKTINSSFASKRPIRTDRRCGSPIMNCPERLRLDLVYIPRAQYVLSGTCLTFEDQNLRGYLTLAPLRPLEFGARTAPAKLCAL